MLPNYILKEIIYILQFVARPKRVYFWASFKSEIVTLSFRRITQNEHW